MRGLTPETPLALQPVVECLGKWFVDAVALLDFGAGGPAQFGEGTEVFHECVFSDSGHARAVVEQAFLHATPHQQRIVGIGKSMSLIADALQQFQGAAVVGNRQRLAFAGSIDLLALLGEADDRKFVKLQFAQFSVPFGSVLAW